MSNREQRTLSVPEGVAGERIDSALTRVLGPVSYTHLRAHET